ncbi:unnamed protein product [Umbelopsis vinacea]
MQRFSIAINLEPKAHHRIEQNILRRRGVGLIGVDKDLVFPGYTLFAPLSSPNTVYLVDNDGRKVHRWILPCPPGRHARILFNGNLAFNGSLPDGPHLFLMWEKYRGGAMLQVDPQGNIVREHHDPLAHHDAHHLENGHILYTTLEELSENTGATVLGGVAGSEAPNARVYADVIKDVDADNNVIWTWKRTLAVDKHSVPFERWKHFGKLAQRVGVIIIEKATGKIIWHLDYNVVAQQHNANELENGNILIFDDGAFRTNDSINFSRVIEVDRNTKEIIWEYRDPQMEAFSLLSWEVLRAQSTVVSDLKDSQLAKVFKNESNALFRAYKYTKEEIPWLQDK